MRIQITKVEFYMKIRIKILPVNLVNLNSFSGIRIRFTNIDPDPRQANQYGSASTNLRSSMIWKKKEKLLTHKVHICIHSTTVFVPASEFGPLSPGTKGGGTLACGWGSWGVPVLTTGKSLALCLLCVLPGSGTDICSPLKKFLCTGDISNPKKLKYNLAYYTKLADELIVNGAHVLCIKVREKRVYQWSQESRCWQWYHNITAKINDSVHFEPGRDPCN